MGSPRRRAWWILAFEVPVLLWLSDRSGYEIRDVKSINWDIALMLTPWGLLHNFIMVPDHYLRPYYQELSERGHLLKDPVLAAAVCAAVALAFLGLLALRRARS